MQVEVIAASVEDALQAAAAGASRLELLGALSEGGLTPSLGLIRVVRDAVTIPAMVLVRPRAGDFCYSKGEIAVMHEDIRACKEAGVGGIVTGVLRADLTIDVDRMREIVALARPLQITFHRAFDMTPVADAALETLIDLGIERVLTSGQASDALAGVALIERLVARADSRIAAMPGVGITPANAKEIASRTRAQELHGSFSADTGRGFRAVDPAAVRAVLAELAGLAELPGPITPP